MKRPRDSQRQKVYSWEQATLSPKPDELTFDECCELVRRVWAAYRPGERPPAVKDGRGTRHASGGRWAITLPRFYRNRPCVLHEAAHSLLSDRYAQGTAAWHGPEWLRLHTELLARVGGFERAALLRSARAAGLKVSRSVPLKPKARLGRAGSLKRPACRHEWAGDRLFKLEQRRWGVRLMERRVYDRFSCRKCGERVSAA